MDNTDIETHLIKDPEVGNHSERKALNNEPKSTISSYGTTEAKPKLQTELLQHQKSK